MQQIDQIFNGAYTCGEKVPKLDRLENSCWLHKLASERLEQVCFQLNKFDFGTNVFKQLMLSFIEFQVRSNSKCRVQT